MPQTLLALCAILAFTYFAMGSQRHDADVDRRAQALEVERAATGVARARVGELERFAFDDEAADRAGVRITPSPDALGPEEPSALLYDDIDDWDGTSETEVITIGGGTLTFLVSVSVGYVQDLAPSQPSSTPTLTKEVVVTAVEQPAGAIDRPVATATVRRVITPAGAASALR